MIFVNCTDANDLNHYDAGAGNAGTSGAGNIESSGALPLYAVVDTSDGNEVLAVPE